MSETGGVRLATSGDDLKVFETSGYSIIHQYGDKLSSSGIRSNSWSADASCVASLLKGRNQIVLTYGKSGRYTSQEVNIIGVDRPSLVRFPRTNQKQVVLTAGGNVHFYDIARSKIKKSFSFRSPVSCMAVNHCDSYLAAGCLDGSLVLATLASNQISTPLVGPKCVGQRLTSVQYSKLKPSLLGTSCESGNISIWDVNANKPLFSLSPHCAPCTELIFSPINDTLALSVGLDKRLVCCDTKAKKVIQSIECENPLTAADFNTDGVTIAVGTSRGKLLVYDLRSPKSPFRVVEAHSSAISSLVYQHEADKSVVSQVMSTVRTSRSASKMTRQEKLLPALVTVQEESKENSGPVKVETSLSPAVRKESISSQLFSPIRDSDVTADSGQKVDQQGGDSKPVGRRVSEVRLSTEGLFSPLREVNSPTNSLVDCFNYIKKGGSGVNSFSTPVMSPLTSIQEEGITSPSSSPFRPPPLDFQEKLSLDKLTEFVKKASSGDRSPEFDHKSSGNQLHGVNQRLRFSASKEVNLVGNDEDEAEAEPTIVKPSLQPSTSSDFTTLLTAFPGVVLDLPISDRVDTISDTADRIATQLIPESDNEDLGAVTFQRNYITGVVGDAMEDWCQGMDRRLWGLQYSLLRQLQQHQEDTRDMLSQTRGAELEEEMEQLRRENKELKQCLGKSILK